MPSIEKDDMLLEIDEIVDELQLELTKEEKKARKPMPLGKIVIVLVAVFLTTTGLAVGIAALINLLSQDEFRDFSEWASIMLMILGGFAICIGGMSGFWGGQRKIPIRLVGPSDASVIGTGFIICGYIIEDCLDNEVEITIYSKDGETLFEKIVPLDEEGLFFSEVDKELFSVEKTAHLTVEAWMVSRKSKKLRFLMREKKLEQMNIVSEGFKIGKFRLFPRILEDFSSKATVIFDPRRKEKGMIEKVSESDGKAINVFFPGAGSEDSLSPFSFELMAKMRTNALYTDIRRSRRILYSLLLFAMGLLYFTYPIIIAFT